MKPDGTIHIAYVMHPFGGNLTNLDRASEWCAFLTAQFGALFTAPWIPMCRHWAGNGISLDKGLELDCEAIRRFDSCIAVGGRYSPGMLHERGFADSIGRHVNDASRFERPNDLIADDDAMRSLAEYYGWGPLRNLERAVRL